ncbi:hypothetical protein MLD38_012641 [Melastoma candidum]|uniref:Uncharacterized protein n=1 Tax=Melastoma candidum TaxID=119954 RepID=A0ACB9RAM2_9MYRT|nr:hypothetical protein MLD38_012641 [Melastoma candidum]
MGRRVGKGKLDLMPFLYSRFPSPIPHFNCRDCGTAFGPAIGCKPAASVTLGRRTLALLIPLVEETSSVNPFPANWQPWCPEALSRSRLVSGCRRQLQAGVCPGGDVDVMENHDNTRPSDAGLASKEMERRRKIGLANKGKVPWNVGIKHSEATRERIRQRTIQALRNPKVKKKIAEHPRTLSVDTKAKISSSQRRRWRERWKQKQLAEKFFASWTEKIARMAKIGWKDEGNLEWDSYEKIKEDISLQRLHCRAEEGRAKNKARMRAQRAAEARVQKMTLLAQKRKDRQEKRKQRQEHRKPSSTQVTRHWDAVAGGINLKKRLMKIHKKRTATIQVACRGSTNTIVEIPSWENVDLEHIRREKAQREVSLADQIRAARSRAKPPCSEALAVPSSVHVLKGLEVE